MWPIYFYHDGSREWVKMKQIVYRFDEPVFINDIEKSYNHPLFKKRVPNFEKEKSFTQLLFLPGIYGPDKLMLGLIGSGPRIPGSNFEQQKIGIVLKLEKRSKMTIFFKKD